jgi:general L-amino acid transport system permease protein
MNHKDTPPAQPPRRRLSWNDPGVRSVIYQILAVGIVGGIVWYLVHNTMHNLSVRNITTGFGFLSREAGFAIGETPISYTPADTYARAITVGLLNTLRVALIGIRRPVPKAPPDQPVFTSQQVAPVWAIFSCNSLP